MSLYPEQKHQKHHVGMSLSGAGVEVKTYICHRETHLLWSCGKSCQVTPAQVPPCDDVSSGGTGLSRGSEAMLRCGWSVLLLLFSWEQLKVRTKLMLWQTSVAKDDLGCAVVFQGECLSICSDFFWLPGRAEWCSCVNSDKIKQNLDSETGPQMGNSHLWSWHWCGWGVTVS